LNGDVNCRHRDNTHFHGLRKPSAQAVSIGNFLYGGEQRPLFEKLKPYINNILLDLEPIYKPVSLMPQLLSVHVIRLWHWHIGLQRFETVFSESESQYVNNSATQTQTSVGHLYYVLLGTNLCFAPLLN
jgi:hypothetical protein